MTPATEQQQVDFQKALELLPIEILRVELGHEERLVLRYKIVAALEEARLEGYQRGQEDMAGGGG